MSLADARSKLSSQVGSSLFNPSLKGYASSFISESLFKNKKKAQRTIDMSRDNVKRFEYGKNSVQAHEGRFENISLPQISTRNKRTPSLVHYGSISKDRSTEGR